MTTRSNASSVRVPREDQDVYSYALRVAVLSHAIHTGGATSAGAAASTNTASSAPATTPGAGGGPKMQAASLSRPTLRQSMTSSTTSSFRPADGWTNALFSFSSSSSSSSSSKAKFPKEFPKVLEARMIKIFQGQDSAHNEQLFRATVGAFFGVFKEKSFQLKLAQNRQIEEVILSFVTTASGLLKKRLPDGDEWKTRLNEQVGEFVSVVRDGLRSCRGVSPELLQRLESYVAKLVPPSSSSSLAPSSASNYASGSSADTSPAASTSKLTLDQPPPPVAGMVTNVHEMPLVLAVGRLFGKSEAELTRDVVALRRLCTEQAAFKDLKACINNVAQGARFPARREDFDSDDAFAAWRKQESDELQELLLDMLKRTPELVHTAAPSEVIRDPSNGHSSLGPGSNRSSVVGGPSPDGSLVGDGSEEAMVDLASFVFVPPDPKFYFKRLYEIALDYDYEAMKDLPPDQDVSLTILSPVHEELLDDCATRWRVMRTVRAGTFLALIGQHYKLQGIPESCVGEALGGVERVAHEWSYWRWPWADRNYLFKTLSALFDNLLSRFFEVFQGVVDLPFEDVVELLEIIYSNEVFREDIRDLAITFQELQQGMRKFVAMAYEEKQIDVDSMERPHDLHPFLVMLDWIRAEAKAYDHQFPVKVMENIDVPAIFISIAGPWFVQHLDASRGALLSAASQAEGAANDADLLELYRGVIELQKMHNAFCPEYVLRSRQNGPADAILTLSTRREPLVIDFSAWFEPYVRRWLATTDTKTMQWVQAAIKHDRVSISMCHSPPPPALNLFTAQFEPEGDDSHSSSIIDLIDSCKSATDFILALDWPNEYENAKYLTGLSQTIAKSIEQYAKQLELMFVEEMFPRDPQEAIDKDVARPSAWLTKAKLAVQGDKKVEPFVFMAETCVKLNNIQAARKLLDTMYNTLDADKVSRIVEINAPPPPPQSGPPSYLFTVKIVLGEDLMPPEGHSRTKRLDPFLILSDPNGFRVAKTRTLYETNDPRWDETIDVSVKGDLWLRATVYNRNLVDHHDNIGCAYIHLDPKKFSDFLTKDLWFQLEDSHRKPLDSRLSLRISMEGEKDDIQFYFGRAFRSLKRAENDMMSPFVRHYISQSTLKALVKTSYNFDIDLDKVRGDLGKVGGKLNAYVRDAISGPSYVIPPVNEYHGTQGGPVSLTAAEKMEKKKGRGPLTDLEIEDAIGDLFDYFNDTFGTLKQNLSSEAWDLVITRLWKDILTTIEGLIVPPLSDRPTEMKMLSDKEVDIVFKWLGFLVNFFHGQGDGVPLEDLRNAKYREIVEARLYYDWSPDQLMEEAVKLMQKQLLNRSDSISLGRSKSVYQQRNLGTIRARKIEKKQSTSSTSGEMILRVLRLHPNTSEFLTQQLTTMQSLQAEQARKQAQRGSVGSLQRRMPNGGGGGGRQSLTRSRASGGMGNGPPPLPPMPEQQQ
uniref:Uncharacterized protein n=1 Tax=Leucosporidium scottii TaxID=5278 RepID=A0A0H5FS74_9BASI|nr:hypothetical protein ls5931a1_00048 [Leucosporidium scottii]